MRLDVDVSGQQRAVGDRDVIAKLAVVGHVGGGHQEVMAPDPGHAVFLLRAAIDRDPLADDVMVADLDPGGGPLVRDILGLAADDGERVDRHSARQAS